MNFKHYLERIGIFDTNLKVSLETLCYLQRQHLLHVPFENINIRNGSKIMLDPSCFYEKIVVGKRGGYCYECNGLFFELLRALGFDVKMISGRVVHRQYIGQDFDHLALTVTLNGAEWLVDTGFGDFSLTPLRIPIETETLFDTSPYKIQPYGTYEGRQYLAACRWSALKKAYMPLYLFTTIQHQLDDFETMNLQHQTTGDSKFIRNLICNIFTPSGRTSLLNNRLTIIQNNKKEEQLIYTAAAMQGVFTQYFGLVNTLVALPT